MLAYITPHLYLGSVLELEASWLRAHCLEGLLLDMDCTLKDHRSPVIGHPVQVWLRELSREGIRLCLVSNGRSERIGGVARELGIPFVAKAFKPFPFGCWAGVRKLGLPPARIAMVGDQLFADVLAGRFAGLFTILVRPTSEEEPWFTRLKRPLERRVLKRLTQQPSFMPHGAKPSGPDGNDRPAKPSPFRPVNESRRPPVSGNGVFQ